MVECLHSVYNQKGSVTYFLSFATSLPSSVRPPGVSEEFRADTSGDSDSSLDDPVIF